MPVAPLARVVRSGFVEGLHLGSAVALAPDGTVVAAAGEPDAPILPRSALKPLQLLAMLRSGLDLGPGPNGDELLALAQASHSGEPFHQDGARAILAAGGLTEADLDNTPDLPLDPAIRQAWLCAGRAPTALAQNCSGKHAAMLVTCGLNGWPTRRYRDPGHPLQRRITATVAELAGEPVSAIAVDGCGAPALAISLTGLARAFSTLARAGDPKTPAGRVAGAIRARPEWLGGSDREVTRLIRAVPGLIAKDGAEAVYAAALPDGRAAAVKVSDGGDRARLVVLLELLARLGVPGGAPEGLSGPVILGHGEPVGAVLPVDF